MYCLEPKQNLNLNATLNASAQFFSKSQIIAKPQQDSDVGLSIINTGI